MSRSDSPSSRAAVEYLTDSTGIQPSMIEGFFVGWGEEPTAETLIAVMDRSYRRVWAVTEGRVVGYINAISDGVLNAFIPWLEIHPEYQGRGIGGQLIRRIVAELDGMYAIDLCCDHELVPYYERLGFTGFAGAGVRVPGMIALKNREIASAVHDQ